MHTLFLKLQSLHSNHQCLYPTAPAAPHTAVTPFSDRTQPNSCSDRSSPTRQRRHRHATLSCQRYRTRSGHVLSGCGCARLRLQDTTPLSAPSAAFASALPTSTALASSAFQWWGWHCSSSGNAQLSVSKSRRARSYVRGASHEIATRPCSCTRRRAPRSVPGPAPLYLYY